MSSHENLSTFVYLSAHLDTTRGYYRTQRHQRVRSRCSNMRYRSANVPQSLRDDQPLGLLFDVRCSTAQRPVRVHALQRARTRVGVSRVRYPFHPSDADARGLAVLREI